MTVQSETREITYNCNGSVDEFAFSYPFFLSSDLVVTLITVATEAETVLTETTHYSIATTGNTYRDGGEVTTVATYSSDYQIRIERVVGYKQETEYNKFDAFPAQFHEDALDRLTMMIQQIRDLTVSIPISTAVNQGDVIYYNGTNWIVLPAGVSGLALITGGMGANPAWGSLTGNGDVVGPSSSTDNCITIFNGTTGKAIQVTGWTIDDDGKMTFPDNAVSGMWNVTARSTAPTTPVAGDIYLDDGTNTGSGSTGFMIWSGSAWGDLGGGSLDIAEVMSLMA